MAKGKKIRGSFKEEEKYRIIVDRIDHGRCLAAESSGGGGRASSLSALSLSICTSYVPMTYVCSKSLCMWYVGKYLTFCVPVERKSKRRKIVQLTVLFLGSCDSSVSNRNTKGRMYVKADGTCNGYF